MKNLKNTTELVKHLLQTVPATRNSDDFLYIKVCESIGKQYVNLPFQWVIMCREDFGFPAFETVRRTRQKIQQHNPELAASPDVEAMRMVLEKDYREYARQVNV